MIDAGSSFPMVPPPLQLPRYSVDARGNAPTSPVPPASWLRTMCSMYWPKGDGGHRNICYLIPHQGPEMELFTTASPRFGIEPRLSSDPRFWKTRRMTTTPTMDKDELNDDHSYDGWK
ncbi:hypothetical protein U9M48_004136 [Paspalum notatum var. saurae]|uniref:Uncharacterized protein n=1 Tax=Paspalum notatum var. saurae TaxID=547442 RepID=A0AAQ3PLG2_PASNO